MFLSSTRLFLLHPSPARSSADDIIITDYRIITIYKMHKNPGIKLCKLLVKQKNAAIVP